MLQPCWTKVLYKQLQPHVERHAVSCVILLHAGPGHSSKRRVGPKGVEIRSRLTTFNRLLINEVHIRLLEGDHSPNKAHAGSVWWEHQRCRLNHRFYRTDGSSKLKFGNSTPRPTRCWVFDCSEAAAIFHRCITVTIFVYEITLVVENFPFKRLVVANCFAAVLTYLQHLYINV